MYSAGVIFSNASTKRISSVSERTRVLWLLRLSYLYRAIIVALTVIARRKWFGEETVSLDLSEANLKDASLSEANLEAHASRDACAPVGPQGLGPD